VQPERDQLLQREPPFGAQEPPQRRALEVLDEQVRARPVEDRVEAAQDHGVRERVERLRLAGQVVERVGIRGDRGAQQLGDHDREALVVPHEQHLVAAAAAERLEHGAARGDLVALPQLPALVCGHAGDRRSSRAVQDCAAPRP
jgi:hypothetical protein